MKKSGIFILILLLLQIVSAVEFDMKDEFKQGETLLARVSGYFLEPILKENIFFYRDHVRISINPSVAQINEEFYIYAPLSDKGVNNYSIVLKNLRYMKGSIVSEEDIIKEFIITNETADFSINPGFVVTEGDFYIEVQNLKDEKIIVNSKVSSEESSEGFFSSLFEDSGLEGENTSVSLRSGEIKKIDFELVNITSSTLRIIELSTSSLKYEIPVYIYTESEEKEQRSFKIEPPELNITLPTNSSTDRKIYVYNTGKETLENITISLSDSLKPYITLYENKINTLEENSSVRIELIISPGYTEKTIEGQISAKDSSGIYSYTTIYLTFIKDYISLDEDDSVPPSPLQISKTCKELGGGICGTNEKCSKEAVHSKDGNCCLGTCESPEPGIVGKIIGWTIVIAVIVLLIWFFKTKYSRAGNKPVNLLSIAKGKK
ncbi:MAG: hypothetical protein KKF68_00045 [Nanoarchaeota archaeon]|nr:hypothetical protein [Nanoarchaeota archaeon]